MQPYYKFLGKASSFQFRKNYFLERLRYIESHLRSAAGQAIWDCGCGYGTTAIFLALNGIAVHGTTLEFYFPVIQKRLDFWRQHGDVSGFTCSYENLFDAPPTPATYDWIIVQDTLHHLEPIDEAIRIFHQSLKPGGRILAIEENGNNIIQQAKLYKYRGNKRIINYWDEKLQKHIPMGNENIRPLKAWRGILRAGGFAIDEPSVNYVRYFLPYRYRISNGDALLTQERHLQQKSSLRREYFFFGLNFVARKQ